MFKLRKKKQQSGQAMVEFALVLPIFPLIILGIIAFGHMLFVYFSVVSASREAARWGAATGTSTNGGPRYRDCDAIRDAAVRVGNIAGVKPGSVDISYDGGPDDVTAHPACPQDVELYDRIRVTVTVNYTPIVPFLDMIPSFPITANSRRTIIMGLPVGEVPAAGSVEPTTIITLIPSPDATATSSKPGASQAFSVLVSSSDGSVPTGTITFKDTTTNTNSSCGASFAPTAAPKICSFTFATIGAHNLTVTYTPTGMYIGASPYTLVWIVSSKLTVTTFTSINPPSSQALGSGIDVVVHVAVKSPDTGTPTGNVSLTWGDKTAGPKAIDGSGNVTFSAFTPTKGGTENLVAVYAGNATFGSSQASQSYSFVGKKTPILTPSVSPTSGYKVGNNITFKLKVERENVGDPQPTGTVLFTDNASPAHSCTDTVAADGTTDCTWKYDTAGLYTVTATYQGDTVYNSGSRVITVNVILGILYDTITTITVAPDPGFVNQDSTITVKVTSAGGTPTGVVDINGPGGLTCPNPITLNASGVATCTYKYTQVNLPSKLWQITANYASNDPASFKDSTATVQYMVNQAETAITITPKPLTDAFVLGSPVVYTVQVTSPQGGTPVGTVTLNAGSGITCSNVALTAGKMTCSATYPAYGTYTVTATYTSTDTGFANSGPTSILYYAWPVTTPAVNKCPRPTGALDFSTAGQINFTINNPNNGSAQSITEVDVYWPDSSQANLKQINLKGASIFSDNGLPPTILLHPFSPAVGSLAKNSNSAFNITFDHGLGSGPYVVVIKFSASGCSFAIRGNR